jgi:quinol monooxygenase YgiN
MMMKLVEKPNAAVMSKGQDGHVAFTVTIALKPGCEEAFLDLLTPVLDAMRHETTFINAVLHQDPQDPTRFMIYETWADLDDVVEVQMHREYRKAYWERLPDLLREPREVQTWKPMRRDFAFFAAW